MPTIQESVDALVVETTGLTNTVSGRITDMTNKVAAADLAKGAAENAKSGAEIAQSGAETAETAANTAKTLAQTAKTNAETASTSAASSSSAAGTSESNASSSATASENSAIASASSATAASTDASTATTKASDASTSETNASTAASTAATKASEASTSAGNAASAEAGASTSETNASTSASIASTKASDASSSATAASTSETNASSSASSASTSDTNASSSATAAAGSASTAASTLSNRYTKSETDAKIDGLENTIPNNDNWYIKNAWFDNTMALNNAWVSAQDPNQTDATLWKKVPKRAGYAHFYPNENTLGILELMKGTITSYAPQGYTYMQFAFAEDAATSDQINLRISELGHNARYAGGAGWWDGSGLTYVHLLRTASSASTPAHHPYSSLYMRVFNQNGTTIDSGMSSFSCNLGQLVNYYNYANRI